MWYADSMSSLATCMRAPRPSVAMTATISSTVTYCREHSNGVMPSLMLHPLGDKRSTMRHYFPEVWPLRITPNLLKWVWGGVSWRVNGPSKHPAATSLSMYSTTTCGCVSADRKLLNPLRRGQGRSNPTLNPSSIPLTM